MWPSLGEALSSSSRLNDAINFDWDKLPYTTANTAGIQQFFREKKLGKKHSKQSFFWVIMYCFLTYTIKTTYDERNPVGADWLY